MILPKLKPSLACVKGSYLADVHDVAPACVLLSCPPLLAG